MTQKHWLRPWKSSLILSGVILGLCAPLTAAYADVVVCDPQDPKSCSLRLSEGVTAPFSGTLLTDRKLATLIAMSERANGLVQIAQEEANEKYNLMVASYESRTKNLEAYHNLEKDLMMKRMNSIAKLSGLRWYEHPIFVATIAVAATVGVFYGATEVVKATR